MQPSKTSKKTSKTGQEPVVSPPETSTPAPETNSKSRASKSRATKALGSKKRTSETGRAKHRSATVAEPAMDSPVIDPVGVMTALTEAQKPALAPVETSFGPEVKREHIASLAHSYWVARDNAYGSAEEDWHRAERELKNKR